MAIKKAWESQNEIDDFLHRREVGLLSCISPDGWPWTVPLNFLWHGGSIFFHCGVGQKLEYLRRNPKVSFVVTEELGVLTTEITQDPCQNTQLGLSVYIRGLAREISDSREKERILRKLTFKYDSNAFEKDEEKKAAGPEKIMELHSFNSCAVVEIETSYISGFCNLLQYKPVEYRKAVAAHFQEKGAFYGCDRDLKTAQLILKTME